VYHRRFIVTEEFALDEFHLLRFTPYLVRRVEGAVR
jgi:hypothetical protein